MGARNTHGPRLAVQPGRERFPQGVNAPTHALPGFQDQWFMAGPEQFGSRSQAGHSGTDDQYLFRLANSLRKRGEPLLYYREIILHAVRRSHTHLLNWIHFTTNVKFAGAFLKITLSLPCSRFVDKTPGAGVCWVHLPIR